MEFEKTILVVEDDVEISYLLTKRLNQNGFRTEAVCSVEEAIELIRNGFEPDLILLDLGLKKVSGTALLGFLRKKIYRHIPVVVMSGYSNQEIINLTIDLGARAFLPKPYTPQELLSTVQHHLN